MNVLYIVSDDARPEMPSFGPVENQWSVPFETKNLLENTDGGVLRHPRFGASHPCSLGTAACYLSSYTADPYGIDAVIVSKGKTT